MSIEWGEMGHGLEYAMAHAVGAKKLENPDGPSSPPLRKRVAYLGKVVSQVGKSIQDMCRHGKLWVELHKVFHFSGFVGEAGERLGPICSGFSLACRIGIGIDILAFELPKKNWGFQTPLAWLGGFVLVGSQSYGLVQFLHNRGILPVKNAATLFKHADKIFIASASIASVSSWSLSARAGYDAEKLEREMNNEADVKKKKEFYQDADRSLHKATNNAIAATKYAMDAFCIALVMTNASSRMRTAAKFAAVGLALNQTWHGRYYGVSS